MRIAELTPLLLLLACIQATVIVASAAPHAAIVREYDQAFTTYPYSDPDPVPAMSRFYPYFRYDGFTDTAVQKKWKVVELSNDYVQLLILPEIGGKVWAAIDKTTGKPFIYFNHVVKFRDVSMRGPWTSGGMEANYGIMGHTPNCFSPVDYLVRRNPDGSASCIVGVLDLLTRSTWRLEINLPAGQACFTTRSLWHNASEFEEPYYTWMNVGIKASGNLEFVNPGTRYLGHDGLASAWPMDPNNGHNLAWYNQNDFGSYKSYHVEGRLSEFFGGYWHDEDFGMAHYATYADKPGRKIWIWGLAREGMIWEKLLTDTDGQYVEVQSGRLFNQAMDSSSLTPFKQLGFAPHATDTWTEYWLPVKGTKGFVSASPYGALNVAQESGRLIVRICPVRPLRDKLEVFDGGRLLYSKPVQLRPMQPVEEVVSLASPARNLKVCVGGDKLQYAAAPDEALSRPVTAPADFDWTSAYGLYLKGRESARQRTYVQAAEAFGACLKREPNFAPALVEMAALANRRADFAAGREFALKALRVDTYDPGANYQLGLASVGLGRATDAKEAFSIAALSPAWRSAACLELARAFVREQRYERALASVQAALDSNSRNLDALQLRVCLCRLQGDAKGAQAALKALLELDPINHFARFEQYLEGKARRADFTGLIRNELPQESYLELAVWYHSLGLDAEGVKVLELAPPTAEVLYWLAYLARDTKRLAPAEAASPALVFPFRPESLAVFDWAAQQHPAWQPRYYLALIRWHQGELAEARALLAGCGEEPRFGPFYAARAQLCESNTVSDLQRAAQLDPDQWRYGAMLARHHLEQGDSAAALGVAADYAQRFPTNSVLALLHAKMLMSNHRCEAAAELLDSLNLLPCEGSTDAHELFREAYLMLAVARLKTGAFAEARQSVQKAREWPEHLGAGKPYPADVDERLEDLLAYQCALGAKDSEQARHTLDRLLAWQPPSHSKTVGEVVRALALKASGRTHEAQQMLNDWLKEQPDSEVAKWGLDVLAGQPASLPENLQNSTFRVLTAWLALSRTVGRSDGRAVERSDGAAVAGLPPYRSTARPPDRPTARPPHCPTARPPNRPTARPPDCPTTLSLAGQWRFQLDRNDVGAKEHWFAQPLAQRISLPGALQNEGFGDDIALDTQWTGGVGYGGDTNTDRWLNQTQYAKYRQPGNIKMPCFLQPQKHYVGAAWYQREIEIPAAWQGKRVVLTLERAHWETRVWVDGSEIGSNNSLCTPHIYSLGTGLAPGRHTLSIRVRNDLLDEIDVGSWAHSVTDHTQGNWNGLIGRIELSASSPVWIEEAQVYPNATKKSARVKVRVGNASGQAGKGTLTISTEQSGKDPTPAVQLPVSWDAKGAAVEAEIQLGNGAQTWDEFSPKLQRLSLQLKGEQADDQRTLAFGLRDLSVEGRQFVLNGRPLFFRGTLECCIFPLTGYPPPDVESWKRVIRACQAYGLNHIRFHSWCPPEAAFTAADELGFYLSVEVAAWCTVGDGKPVDRWLYEETDRILRAYGNHPSFMLMAYGNEPSGPNHKTWLAQWVTHYKQTDSRRLYTCGSGYPALPENQYHDYYSGDHPIRGRIGWLGKDYAEAVQSLTVPAITHELGQWCVYPNFDQMRKYTGPLKPKNLEIFRDSLAQHGMLDQWRDFVRASGRLQVLCYKEEIEAALRTPGIGGFHLLDLHDFPGQGTAPVGVLDAFWESKGYVTAKEYRRFCNTTVPLARLLKRVWTTDETLTADVEVAHFGARPLDHVVASWNLVAEDGKLVASGELTTKLGGREPDNREGAESVIPLGQGTKLGRIELNLKALAVPKPYRLVVTCASPSPALSEGKRGLTFENDWTVWVFPAKPAPAEPAGVLIASNLDAPTMAQLDQGGKVLLLPAKLPSGNPRLTFEPIFWCRYFFDAGPQTLGLLCNPRHPALAEFPTDLHQDWQWDEIVTGARAMVLDSLPKDFRPIVQVIDDWNSNRKLGLVWECRVGAGKLLVCSADLEKDLDQRPAARQLRASLLRYIAGKEFKPKVAVRPDDLQQLLVRKVSSKLAKLGARIIEQDSEDNAHGNVAANAIDGDPDTIWHTRWDPEKDALPHHLTLDLGREVTLKGITYLPRQDQATGRIAEADIYCSREPNSWAEPVAKATWPNTDKLQTLMFKQPAIARFLKVVARSEVNGNPFASIAELDIVTDPE